MSNVFEAVAKYGVHKLQLLYRLAWMRPDFLAHRKCDWVPAHCSLTTGHQPNWSTLHTRTYANTHEKCKHLHQRSCAANHRKRHRPTVELPRRVPSECSADMKGSGLCEPREMGERGPGLIWIGSASTVSPVLSWGASSFTTNCPLPAGPSSSESNAG